MAGGKRGPKPTPTAELNLRGSWRGKVRKDEPVVSGLPVRPTFIKGLAKKKWFELLNELGKLNVIGSIDSTTLARYCQLWALYQDLVLDVEKNGWAETLTNKDGGDYLAQRPQGNSLIKIAGLLGKLEDCFGLSPAARSGLKINGTPPEKSALEKMLEDKRNKIKISG